MEIFKKWFGKETKADEPVILSFNAHQYPLPPAKSPQDQKAAIESAKQDQQYQIEFQKNLRVEMVSRQEELLDELRYGTPEGLGLVPKEEPTPRRKRFPRPQKTAQPSRGDWDADLGFDRER
jgi:hypothetical protein